jgi:hypothetical protein
MSLYSYSEFLYETYGKVKADTAKINLLTAISKQVMNEEEQFYFAAILQEGYQDKVLMALESNDCQWLVEELSADEALHESILQKAKEKAAAIAAKVKEKGKEYLDKISDGSKALLKTGGNILQPMQAVIKKIGDVIKSMWEKGKALAQAAVSTASEEIAKRIKNIIKDGDKKKSLLDELGNLKQMAGAGVKFLTNGFTGDMAKSAETAAKSDEGSSYAMFLESAMINEAARMIERGERVEDIVEALSGITVAEIEAVFEGGGHGESGGLKIPFISTLMDKIGHTPPFSYFHDIGAKAEKIANSALERASFIISKTGGPGPYKFAVIGALVGVAASYYSESGAKDALKKIVKIASKALHVAIPGIGIVFDVIKYTGLALAIYGIIKAVAGQGEKEEGGDKEKGEEIKDKEKTEEK